MGLSRIVMRLARNPGTEFADGDDHRGYALVAPLTADGKLDDAAFRAAKGGCTVRHFASDEDPMEGKLARRADPDRLATATLAAIQGGLVLTQATRDPQHLATAADAAYDHLRVHARSPRARRHRPAVSSVGRSER